MARRKIRFRFGMKSILFSLLLICLPLAWVQHHHSAFEQEQAAIERLFASSSLTTKRIEVNTGTFQGFNGWASTFNLM